MKIYVAARTRNGWVMTQGPLDITPQDNKIAAVFPQCAGDPITEWRVDTYREWSDMSMWQGKAIMPMFEQLVSAFMPPLRVLAELDWQGPGLEIVRARQDLVK
jgi:hypothetical protein